LTRRDVARKVSAGAVDKLAPSILSLRHVFTNSDLLLQTFTSPFDTFHALLRVQLTVSGLSLSGPARNRKRRLQKAFERRC
jgi:hypothetical protein